MKLLQEKLLSAFMASHHGVVTRQEALALGVTPDQIDWQVRTGRFVAAHRGVYVRTGDTDRPKAGLMAACLALTGVASHRSAAWLWGLRDDGPPRPCVTVPARRSARASGVTIYRRSDLDEGRATVRNQVPVTDPLRTLADLGEEVTSSDLDDAIDRALARRLVTVTGLDREVERLARPGRRGVPQLRAALMRRGFVAAPTPSVLESRTVRLLRRWGITPLGVEVAVLQGRYRLDFELSPGVALEVDGYAYHWSPEAKAADSHRRNELRLAGVTVIESDWVTVTREPERLRRMICATVSSSDSLARS